MTLDGVIGKGTTHTKTNEISGSRGLDIDANSGDVTIDSALGSILIGTTLSDSKTLKLGKTDTTEMIFAPHDTVVKEKISLTNTSGTADDAILIVSSAGSITLSCAPQGSGTGGNIILTNLPTTDPNIEGALYNSNGTLKISSGNSPPPAGA